MPLHLLDTSACVDILRGRIPSERLPALADCCLSAIVTAELRTGLAKAPTEARRAKLEDFLGLFSIREFDDEASREYAVIRADLQRRGIPIGPMDLLIAAHARSLNATLVTANVAEFRRVKGLKVLKFSVQST